MENQTGRKRKVVKKIIDTITPLGPGKKQIKKELKVSEEKYKAAFEYTGTGMMVLEDDMTISLINQKMCELTGYSRDEVEGKRKWTELVSEKDVERMMEYHLGRRVDAGEAPSQYEFKYKHRSGAIHDALITVSMIPGSKQSLVSMMDINEMKETEKKLMESQKRFKETADLLPGIICEFNRDMQFTYVNKIGLEKFGYTQEEFDRGIELKNVIHKDDLDSALESASLVMAGEKIGPQEYRLVHKNGTVKDYIIVSSQIIKNENGVGIRSCLMDISERKRIEQQLSESEERFRSMYAASPIGIALFNVKGSTIDMNASFKRMFGLPESIDYDRVDFSLFDHINEMKNCKSKLIKNGGMNFESGNDFKFAKSKDVYEFIPTGNRYLNWHITPLGIEAESASMFLAQVQDITERKRSEEAKLKEAQKVAEEASRMVEGLRREIYQSAQFQNMISRSTAMQEIFDILPEISRTSTTVLITGESGTGKELIAKSIHELSPRRSKPFIAINCGALPDNLLESELFGYKAGAFTDAKKDKPGKFALADRGTIFLDEIGDISPAMQVKLLRVLQEKVFEPLGATKSVTVDVHVVAATNKNLPEMVKEGLFREDLFYRIKILSLALPALRDRKSDIPLLCDHFISLFNARYKKNITELSNDALDVLLAHDYPGNIRELENTLEHAFIFCKGSVIECKHLPPEVLDSVSCNEKSEVAFAGIDSFEDLERMFIKNVLKENDGSRIKSAKKLGIHKATLFRKMKSLGIEGV